MEEKGRKAENKGKLTYSKVNRACAISKEHTYTKIKSFNHRFYVLNKKAIKND